MWYVKAKVIPVIIGATGTNSKSFRHYLSNILGKHKIKELQKTGTLDTILIEKFKTFFMCEITLHVAQLINT